MAGCAGSGLSARCRLGPSAAKSGRRLSGAPMIVRPDDERAPAIPGSSSGANGLEAAADPIVGPETLARRNIAFDPRTSGSTGAPDPDLIPRNRTRASGVEARARRCPRRWPDWTDCPQ